MNARFNLLARVRLLAALALVAGLPACVAHAEKLKTGTFVIRLDSPIGTRTSKVGDTFVGSVIEPEMYAGATVEGKVTKVEAAMPGSNDKARIVFGFSTITLADMTTFKIQAELKDITGANGLKSVDAEGQAISVGNGAKRAMMAGGGAAAGAIIGGFFGGGMGALIGGAAGGAAGFFVAHEVTAGGQNMDFATGTQFTVDITKSSVDKQADSAAIRAQEAAAVASNATVAAAPPAAPADPAAATQDSSSVPAPSPAPVATPVADTTATPNPQ